MHWPNHDGLEEGVKDCRGRHVCGVLGKKGVNDSDDDTGAKWNNRGYSYNTSKAQDLASWPMWVLAHASWLWYMTVCYCFFSRISFKLTSPLPLASGCGWS